MWAGSRWPNSAYDREEGHVIEAVLSGVEPSDRRAISRSCAVAFRAHDRAALPVTDSAGLLIGIVTIDDVLDVVEATVRRAV